MSEIDGVPFVTFGNNELGAAKPVKKGDRIECDQCGGVHDVALGKDESGAESPMLQFIRCDRADASYLVGVAGKSVMKAHGPFRLAKDSRT